MKLVDFRAKDTILSAVRKYVTFIAPTYGPAGKSILISEPYNTKAVDDGKIASQSFELEDEFEQAVIEYIKGVTAKTDDRVGDGTTTSAIIMSALVEEVFKKPENQFTNGRNPHAEALAIKHGLQEAIAAIKKASKPIKTKDELYEIAYNSYNNEEVAHLIADTLFTIGIKGVLAIEDSPTMKTEVEVVQGLEISKGYLSPYLMTKEGEVSHEKPAVVLINKKIEFFKELTPLVTELLQAGKKSFVIVAHGFSEEVIHNTILNKLKDFVAPNLVEVPSFGVDKLELLQDIATVVGGIVIDPDKGDTLVGLDKFGEAQRVTSKKDTTVFVGGKGTKKALKERTDLLEAQILDAQPFLKEKLTQRLAALVGGVAVLKIGAATENEQKTMKAKVEDAVNASKVAFKDGVVPGAGETYASITTASEVLNKALKEPRKKLEDNGKEFLDEKVFDPTEVLVAALESGVSIACGLIEMGGIIATKRKKEDKDY